MNIDKAVILRNGSFFALWDEGGQKVAQSCELSFDILVSIRNAVLRLSMEVVLPVEWKCFVRGQMRNDR